MNITEKNALRTAVQELSVAYELFPSLPMIGVTIQKDKQTSTLTVICNIKAAIEENEEVLGELMRSTLEELKFVQNLYAKISAPGNHQRRVATAINLIKELFAVSTVYLCLANHDLEEGHGPDYVVCAMTNKSAAEKVVGSKEFGNRYGVMGTPYNPKHYVKEIQVYGSMDDWLKRTKK